MYIQREKGYDPYNQGAVSVPIGGTNYDLNAAFGGGGRVGNYGGGGANEWSNERDVDMAFGMWMEELGESRGDGFHDSDAGDDSSQRFHSNLDSEKRNSRREEIARKLLESEEKYVKLLGALINTIVKPCMGEGSSRHYSAPLSHQEAHDTFGALQADEVLSVNEAFRKQLSARMKDYNNDTCFGDLFVRLTPFLKVYIDYCTQHDSSASRVGMLAKKNDDFQSVLNESSMDPRCMGLDVQSLLNLPMERIPEYKDILEELQMNTDESHPDFNLLDKAIEEIADVSNFIDESIKQRENQAKILGVQAMLSDPNDLDLKETGKRRIYVKSGVMMKLGRRADRKDYFALFSDGLLHAKKALVGNKFNFKRLTEILRVEDVGFIKSKPKANHVFRVVANGHIYLLSASTAEEKSSWMRVLQMVLHGTKRKQLHQGPLNVVKLDKANGEIKPEFFYVFTDVVVCGKSLWRGKFKYKQTIYVQRVEEHFKYDPHRDPPIPPDLATNMAIAGGLDNCFRIIHSSGASTLLMASSKSDKALWLKALNKLLEYQDSTTSKQV